MTRYLAAAVVAFLCVAPAHAHQLQCGLHDPIVSALKENGEVLVGKGLALRSANPSLVTELFASPDGTWTMLITNARGQSCIVDHGNGWQAVTPEVPGSDA